MPSRKEIQSAAAALGFNVPYHARVVGDRIEFHLRGGQVLYWPPTLEPRHPGPELAKGSKAQVYKVAAALGIRGRSSMSKAELLNAIKRVRDIQAQE